MTADTSAVVAALSGWHDHHETAAEALREVAALPSHVRIEAYSILTRLPGGLAVPATTAAAILDERFPAKPLDLAHAERADLLTQLADAGVFGGATYDGIVALEAAVNGEVLITRDRRAQETYRRLGASFELIA